MIRSLPTFVVACVLAGPLLAQTPASTPSPEVHRLEVRGGVIYHNGVALPPSAIPEGVDIDGFDPISMDYSGDVTPAIEIDGRVFALKGNRLVEVQDAKGEQGAAREVSRAQAYMISEPKAASRAVAGTEAASRQRVEQDYLDSLSESDRALYDQLVRERDMEAETLRLAQRYRRATTDAERETLRAQLRDKLGAMFDLKEANRREEVRQMEAALEELRQRMNERNAMRDAIIEHRLDELLGQ